MKYKKLDTYLVCKEREEIIKFHITSDSHVSGTTVEESGFKSQKSKVLYHG